MRDRSHPRTMPARVTFLLALLVLTLGGARSLSGQGQAADPGGPHSPEQRQKLEARAS
jgi:hypothetical protein